MAAAKRRKLEDGSASVAGVGNASAPSAMQSGAAHNANARLVWSDNNTLARALPSNGTTLVCLLSRLPSPGSRAVKPARLEVPVKRPGEEIHQLSFSPTSQHLLIATCFSRTEDPAHLTAASAGLRLVLFEQGVSACWQDWQIAHEWIVEAAGADAPQISDLQWLDERPAFGLAHQAGERFTCAPRPGLSAEDGRVFSLVLDNNELLLCRFASLQHKTVLLRTSLATSSVTTIVREASAIAGLGIGTSLIGGIEPSSALLGVQPAAAGTAAAAAGTTIAHAAIGFPPNEQCLLIAVSSRARPTCRPTAEPPLTDLEDALAAVAPAPLPPATMVDDDTRGFLADLDDFGAFGASLGSLEGLDEAFGDLDDVLKDESDPVEKVKKGLEVDATLDTGEAILDQALTMFAVKVVWQGEGDPKLDVERLPALPLCPPGSPSVVTTRQLAHLCWQRCESADPRLGLIAIANTETDAHVLQWRAERDDFKLCEAFDALGAGKPQTGQLDKTWILLSDSTKKLDGRQIQSAPLSPISLNEMWLHTADMAGRSRSLTALDLTSVSNEPTSASLPEDSRELAISATGAVVAHALPAKVKLSPRTRFDSASEAIGASLALSVRSGRDLSDVLSAISALPKAKRSTVGLDIIKHLTDRLRSGLGVQGNLAMTAVAPALLKTRFAILRAAGIKDLASNSLDLLQFVTAAQKFEEACIRSRTAAPASYNLAAAWPLISAAGWYARLCVRLLRALASDTPPAKELILLIDPFSLAAHRAVAGHVANFAEFMSRYVAPADDAVFPIARTVLSDIIAGEASNTVPLAAWREVLAQLSQPQLALPKDTMLALELPQTLPDGLRSLGPRATELLAAVQSTATKSAEAPVDVITLARLGQPSPTAQRRICMRCEGVSDLPKTLADGSVEARWRKACICGGQWSLVA